MGEPLPLLLLLLATSPQAAPFIQVPAGAKLTDDPVLRGLIREAVEKRPELAQARAQIAAEQERVPQTRALPDPTLSLGIQNDGFDRIQIGKMPTSYVSIMASQTFPWAGKRGLRAEVAGLGPRFAASDLQRVQLSLTADVERAYVDLLLVRGQLDVLTRLQSLWEQAEGLARARYEVGETSQSDLLRAQLERSRLRQQRWALQSEEQRRIAGLNRLRGHPLAEPIATTRTLADLPDPILTTPDQEAEKAEAESPEIKKALLAEEQAGWRVALAKRERWPDLTVSAGVMPRGSDFATMWQAGVAMNLPIWTAQKQSRAIAENRARGEAARNGAEAVRQLLRQRVHERLVALAAMVETNHLYRSGLLIQSEATVASTLTQYQVGRVTFASVLEALSGYLADTKGFLTTVAGAQKIDIAEREISLDVPEGPAAERMGGSSIPGAGLTIAPPSGFETAGSSM